MWTRSSSTHSSGHNGHLFVVIRQCLSAQRACIWQYYFRYYWWFSVWWKLIRDGLLLCFFWWGSDGFSPGTYQPVPRFLCCPGPWLSNLTKMHRWTDVTVAELYVFFALLMLMPHIKKHTPGLLARWLSHLQTTVWENSSRDRIMSILWYMHFVDNNSEPERNRIWKIR